MKSVLAVTLVKYPGGQTVGVGSNSFPVENNKVVDSESQRIGAQVAGKGKEYNDKFELAKLAWEAQEFDKIEDNTQL